MDDKAFDKDKTRSIVEQFLSRPVEEYVPRGMELEFPFLGNVGLVDGMRTINDSIADLVSEDSYSPRNLSELLGVIAQKHGDIALTPEERSRAREKFGEEEYQQYLLDSPYKVSVTKHVAFIDALEDLRDGKPIERAVINGEVDFLRSLFHLCSGGAARALADAEDNQGVDFDAELQKWAREQVNFRTILKGHYKFPEYAAHLEPLADQISPFFHSRTDAQKESVEKIIDELATLMKENGAVFDLSKKLDNQKEANKSYSNESSDEAAVYMRLVQATQKLADELERTGAIVHHAKGTNVNPDSRTHQDRLSDRKNDSDGHSRGSQRTPPKLNKGNWSDRLDDMDT